MGLYDYRCMVSGVSLKGSDAALVLLEQAGAAFAPMALAITGNYNRLGAIDGIREDANTALVLDFFLAKLASGELVIDEGEAPEGIGDIEALLQLIERCVTMDSSAAVLNGQRLLYALICRPVWGALVRAAPPTDTPAGALLQELFAEGSVGREIYKGSLSRLTRQLKELAAVSRFLAQRGIAWKPPEDPEQHYSEEMCQFLAEAKRTFHDVPALLQGLRAYEKKAGDLLDDS
jgi:hypothetical protein